jgi:hypothetical protein
MLRIGDGMSKGKDYPVGKKLDGLTMRVEMLLGHFVGIQHLLSGQQIAVDKL